MTLIRNVKLLACWLQVFRCNKRSPVHTADLQSGASDTLWRSDGDVNCGEAGGIVAEILAIPIHNVQDRPILRFYTRSVLLAYT